VYRRLGLLSHRRATPLRRPCGARCGGRRRRFGGSARGGSAGSRSALSTRVARHRKRQVMTRFATPVVRDNGPTMRRRAHPPDRPFGSPGSGRAHPPVPEAPRRRGASHARPRGSPPARSTSAQSLPGSLSHPPLKHTSDPQQSQSLLQEPSLERQHRGSPPHSSSAASASPQLICCS
jgi:hypothetical protein